MTTHCYINRQSSQLQVWAILRVPEVIHNTCNMGARDLPDTYALIPRASGIHIRQIPRAHVTTITYNILLLIAHSCLSITQASSSFKRLDMCTFTYYYY